VLVAHYDLRIQITDNANNVTTTSLPDKVVDNTAPNVALVGAPTEGQLVSGTIAIAASASDATSPIASVRFFVRGSLLGADTTAPFSLNWDTTTGADGFPYGVSSSSSSTVSTNEENPEPPKTPISAFTWMNVADSFSELPGKPFPP